jgi:hypothetical protein
MRLPGTHRHASICVGLDASKAYKDHHEEIFKAIECTRCRHWAAENELCKKQAAYIDGSDPDDADDCECPKCQGTCLCGI